MKVCVLSGSPKGPNSITYQTVLFLEKRFPDCSFTTLHVGQRIRMYEKDMTEALNAIGEAELLLFCYPVYTFIVPAQLHRFLELLKCSGADLKGKYAAQLSTSKHFYDTTAHKFIQENCQDMGLKYLGGLSADMEDLLTKKGQREAISFWRLVLWKQSRDIYEKAPVRAAKETPVYQRSLKERKKLEGKETVIVASLSEGDDSLANRIEDFRAAYPYPTRVVNLNDYPLAGGCLGCFHCAVSGKCIYKDGFDDFLRNRIQTGAAIVYAFTIRDHSMGSRMKMYDDRQFCNGHRTVTMGMPFGYLVNGNLEDEPNLQMIIEGRAQVGGNYLAGVATDAEGIRNLAQTLAYALKHRVQLPSMFLGVGGMKIFRDLIWVMQGMMKADHQFYLEHGFYDFPQKQRSTILKMKLVGALLSNPKLQAKSGNMMTEGMLAPYRKVLDDAAPRAD
ncbi:MAG: NAD(P)H-dependent oxidoreductase [Roseburia sp.]|nr:NAD(P)H-dependent oxidoreductase [Roseburia sp.]MCM1096547.1 NAD(P)H-dependent oxidoreductase [Ruminococcus flavefaciens]